MLPLYSDIDEVRKFARDCVACSRSETRQQVVFGAGNPDAELMLIGEAPSLTDDVTGHPFTGPAGDLLDEMLAAHGLSRDRIWITNLVRCYAGRSRDGRSENRPVKAAEVKACNSWLDLEIYFVNPRVLLAVGSPAAKHLINPSFQLSKERGKIQRHRTDGKYVLATAQPAYAMRLKNLGNASAFEAVCAEIIGDIGTAASLAGLI